MLLAVGAIKLTLHKMGLISISDIHAYPQDLFTEILHLILNQIVSDLVTVSEYFNVLPVLFLKSWHWSVPATDTNIN